jgi:hypothetical protein
MIRLIAFSFLATLFAGVALAQMPGQQRRNAMRHSDGGVRETLESIVVTPVPNAPFTLTLQTEWVRNMGDAGTFTLANQRRIARDGKGRIYEERWALVPKSGKIESYMTAIQLADPIQHTLHTCMMDGQHVCHVTYCSDSTTLPHEVRETRTTTLPDDVGFITREDLGDGSTEGIETIGTRVITIYNPGVMGNDNRFTVEHEYWYSPRLGINLVSEVNDPRFGTQTFTATNLDPSEPDPSLFQMPKGFSAVDERNRAPAVRTSLAPPSPRFGAPSN